MLDDTIDKDIYKRKDIDLDIQIRALEEKIHDVETNAKIDIDAVSRVMEMASNIYQTYKQSNFDAKRLYLKLFFEKFTMKERNIVFVEPTPLFASLQEESGRVSTNWLPRLDSNQEPSSYKRPSVTKRLGLSHVRSKDRDSGI